jgi:TetR/AcrR family transcriptional repressor of lmrAB and yxaGH operons
MAPGVRERMVAGAAQLLSRAGVAETSFSTVVAETGTPRGSIYHHFPGGKDELVAASVQMVGRRLLDALRRAEVTTADEVVVAFAGLFRRVLVDSDATAGCAVAAVSVDTRPASAPHDAARDVFRSWRAELLGLYARAGVPPTRAAAYAGLTVATVEGALVLSRAEGDIALFDDVVDQLVEHVRRDPPDMSRAPS